MPWREEGSLWDAESRLQGSKHYRPEPTGERMIVNANILDVGCSFGDGIEYLKNTKELNTCKFTGIDCADCAVKNGKNVVQLDILDETYSDIQNMDVALCVRLLDYLHTEEQGIIIKKVKTLAPISIFVLKTENVGDKRKFRTGEFFETSGYTVVCFRK